MTGLRALLVFFILPYAGFSGPYVCHLSFAGADNPYKYHSSTSALVNQFPSIRIHLKKISASFEDFKGWRNTLYYKGFDDRKHNQKQLVKDFGLFEQRLQGEVEQIFQILEQNSSHRTFVVQYLQAFENILHGPQDTVLA